MAFETFAKYLGQDRSLAAPAKSLGKSWELQSLSGRVPSPRGYTPKVPFYSFNAENDDKLLDLGGQKTQVSR